MSSVVNNDVINRDLLFYFDMKNTKKSFIGPPTTNLRPNFQLNGMQQVSLTDLGIENGWKKYGLNGAWAAGTYPFSLNMSGISFTGGSYYSTSVKLKTNVPYKFVAPYFSSLSYVNQPMNSGGTKSRIELPHEVILLKCENFSYVSTTSQACYIGSRPPRDGTVFTAATDFVYIKDAQVELSPFSTLFTDSSRATTEVLRDMSGNTIVVNTNLTYSNASSFSFNGTSNYISFPVNIFDHVSGGEFSVSVWFKTTTHGIVFSQTNSSTPAEGTGYVPAIYVDTSGYLRTSCFWGNATANQSVSLIPVNDNNWHNIVVTFKNGSQKSYLDGNLYATLAKTQTFYSATYYYYIGTGMINGWTNAGNKYFTGDINNIAFYLKELTAAQISKNYYALSQSL